MLDRILGLIRPRGHAQLDTAPPAPPVQVIAGGSAAPELAMLCRDGDRDTIAADNTMGVVQLKADGLRAIYINGTIVSREGVPMRCALHCQPALRRIEQAMGCDMVFDCEYVADGGYVATVAEHKRGEGSGVLWIFDAMPLGAWMRGGTNLSTLDRLTILREAVGAAESPFVGMLNWWLMTGAETVAKAAELWAHGYEGVVRKRPDAPYVRARSNDWLRLKQTITADLPIIDTIIKDMSLKAIIARGPEGIGPIKLGKGWSPSEGAELIRHHLAPSDLPFISAGRRNARVSYQLSTGDKRAVRGAVFHSLV